MCFLQCVFSHPMLSASRVFSSLLIISNVIWYCFLCHLFGTIKLFTYLACHPKKTTKSNVYIFMCIYTYVHRKRYIYIYIKRIFLKKKAKKEGTVFLQKKERIVTRIHSKTVNGDKCKKDLWICHS